MKKVVKKQILELLSTLLEAHKELSGYIEEKDLTKANILLSDCQESAIMIGDIIEQSETGQESIIHNLEEYCEKLYWINDSLEKEGQADSKEVKSALDDKINTVYRAVKEEIEAVFKVVFFPYKASMWTSLESIWRAAEADPECEAKVVVIPYHNLDSMCKDAEFVYEAPLFPKDVPITHYDQYDITKEQPDITFIHNPYDNTNNLTRVPEKYYSYHLKPYTDQLVYSPYGMMGYYSPQNGHFMCRTNGVFFSDKTLVQSELVKKIYIAHGASQDKIIALGSPKVDAVVESLKKPVVYPEGWEEKLSGRKVFLYNTHISYFVRGYQYKQQHPDREDYAIWHHENAFSQLLNREGCGLIWRPHPLLKPMLKSRRLFDTLEFVENLEKALEESDNGVLDMRGDYDTSFRISDAMVSTYSSMIPEYMISGKPIFIYEERFNLENCHNSPVDYSNLYYKAEQGEEPKLPAFIQMVLDGEDPLKDKRMADVRKAFSNLDGTIGKNIYHMLKESN